MSFLAVATVIAACADGANGVMCGGTLCGPGEWCEEVYDPCMDAPPPVACVACSDAGPICGEDGQVYPTGCALHAAGHSPGGVCTPPPGLVICGSSFCDAATEYCNDTNNCFLPTCALLPDGGLDAGPPSDGGL